MAFKDHFSKSSPAYRQFRPGYPDKLFGYLASLCADHDLAWDCATGSGQAAASLADHFSRVIATDASEQQVANATRNAGISYWVAQAENSGIDANSVDLITVAQALHWFDIDAFAVEANRVLKADAVLAAWTYGVLTINEKFDALLKYFYSDILGDYWPFERQMVEGGYADINLPFTEISSPRMEMIEQWRFADVVGYLNTWSAVQAYERKQGSNPLDLVRDDLLREWGDASARHVSTWPLTLRVWRKAR